MRHHPVPTGEVRAVPSGISMTGLSNTAGLPQEASSAAMRRSIRRFMKRPSFPGRISGRTGQTAHLPPPRSRCKDKRYPRRTPGSGAPRPFAAPHPRMHGFPAPCRRFPQRCLCHMSSVCAVPGESSLTCSAMLKRNPVFIWANTVLTLLTYREIRCSARCSASGRKRRRNAPPPLSGQAA